MSSSKLCCSGLRCFCSPLPPCPFPGAAGEDVNRPLNIFSARSLSLILIVDLSLQWDYELEYFWCCPPFLLTCNMFSTEVKYHIKSCQLTTVKTSVSTLVQSTANGSS